MPALPQPWSCWSTTATCCCSTATAATSSGPGRWSFGGLFFVDTPQQRFLGIDDAPELALRDWHAFAEFEDDDTWPRRWAEQYVHRCTDEVYRWLRDRGLHFLPVVHWVERGLYEPGNSVPRFHVVWGTRPELAMTLIDSLRIHRNADRHAVSGGGRARRDRRRGQTQSVAADGPPGDRRRQHRLPPPHPDDDGGNEDDPESLLDE